MARADNIQEKTRAYYGTITGEHDRYRSWEHCYSYFRQNAAECNPLDRDHAALQLGFYLASWGMYRGSSFLLQYTYTVHRAAIDQILSPSLSPLWQREFGATENDGEFVPLILAAIDAVRRAYAPFARAADSHEPSDTLVTKILLATFGCLPACDRFFVDGFKSAGLQYSYLNEKFVWKILRFCRDNFSSFRVEQARIENSRGGMHYPLMKLVDMYFWQTGYEHSGATALEGTAR